MIEKLPIFRAIVKILDDEEKLLAGLAFVAAGVFAVMDGISAASRATMMISLVSVGFVVLAGFKPLDIAAYFANRYSHQAGMVAAEGINILEKLAKIDIDDRVETAITLEIEKRLAKLPANPELIREFELWKSQIQTMLGIGPTAEGGQVIPISQPKSSAHPEPPKSA